MLKKIVFLVQNYLKHLEDEFWELEHNPLVGDRHQVQNNSIFSSISSETSRKTLLGDKHLFSNSLFSPYNNANTFFNDTTSALKHVECDVIIIWYTRSYSSRRRVHILVHVQVARGAVHKSIKPNWIDLPQQDLIQNGRNFIQI